MLQVHTYLCYIIVKWRSLLYNILLYIYCVQDIINVVITQNIDLTQVSLYVHDIYWREMSMWYLLETDDNVIAMSMWYLFRQMSMFYLRVTDIHVMLFTQMSV